MQVKYYPSNFDAYRNGNIVLWCQQQGVDYCVEIHRNAFNGNAYGYETIINSRYNADAIDNAIHSAFVRQGFYNR